MINSSIDRLATKRAACNPAEQCEGKVRFRSKAEQLESEAPCAIRATQIRSLPRTGLNPSRLRVHVSSFGVSLV